MSGIAKNSTRSECFLDTNVLIYAAAGRKHEPRKHEIATRLVLTERFGLSAQVLAEFYVNVAGKPKLRLAPAQIDEWFELLCRYPVADVDASLVQRGILIARTHRIQYWDGAIVAAAERLAAPVLYSEDLNDGQSFGSVRVVNPFRTT